MARQAERRWRRKKCANTARGKQPSKSVAGYHEVSLMFSFVANKSALVDAIRKRLDALGYMWDEYPHRRISQGTPHSEMTDIWLRFGDISKGIEHVAGEHESIWYPAAQRMPDEFFKLIDWLYNEVEGVALGGILITKLPAGGRIQPHTDNSWHSREYENFHIAINTPKDSVYWFNSGGLTSQNGDINWFRNDLEHWVENNSSDDRISMIVCIKTAKFDEKYKQIIERQLLRAFVLGLITIGTDIFTGTTICSNIHTRHKVCIVSQNTPSIAYRHS